MAVMQSQSASSLPGLAYVSHLVGGTRSLVRGGSERQPSTLKEAAEILASLHSCGIQAGHNGDVIEKAKVAWPEPKPHQLPDHHEQASLARLPSFRELTKSIQDLSADMGSEPPSYSNVAKVPLTRLSLCPSTPALTHTSFASLSPTLSQDSRRQSWASVTPPFTPLDYSPSMTSSGRFTFICPSTPSDYTPHSTEPWSSGAADRRKAVKTGRRGERRSSSRETKQELLPSPSSSSSSFSSSSSSSSHSTWAEDSPATAGGKRYRAKQTQEGLRNNHPYQDVLRVFIAYNKEEKNRDWKTILRLYERDLSELQRYIRADESQRIPEERTVGGITSKYYRENIEIPRTDGRGGLMFDDQGREDWTSIKVREFKGVRPGAIHRWPELIAKYKFFFIDPEHIAKAVEIATHRDNQRITRGLPTWAEQTGAGIRRNYVRPMRKE